jgi:Stage II sporulation protein M
VRVVDDLVFLQGVGATKETLRRWNRHWWQVMRSWIAGSVVVAFALLAAVYLVARISTPDPSGTYVPGLVHAPTMEDIGMILFRNSLVLALHAFACIAGFIALNSLPYSAARRSGISKTIHEKAGPYAMLFVAGATFFSLSTQAYFLGSTLSSAAAQFDLPNFEFLLLVLPHAVPELTALFLPLAAWLIASRRGDWDQLLAATFVTVAVAVPTLLVSVSIEVFVFPHLIEAAVR